MILVIGGATATGKTSLSVEIAKRFNGEIISADSMQIYRGMDIGTAKVTEEEKGGIPHYMIDVVSPSEPFNVSMYVKMAENVIKDIENRRKVPIVVGGTGLYIRSLLYNYKMGEYDEILRKEIEREYDEKGADHMWQVLAEKDPKGAEKIHKNNIKRVLRALEVFLLTGKSIFDQQNADTDVKEHCLICMRSERKELYDRIDRRVDEMFERGLEREVKRLLEEGVSFDMQSMQGIGYKEFRPYFSGEQSIGAVKDAIKLNSRHYAKRQETWFRAMPTAKWYPVGNNSIILDDLNQIIK